MMLHLKLPKGKVAQACEAAAFAADRKAAVARDAYMADMKRAVALGVDHGYFASSEAIHRHGAKAKELRRMAVAARASNGDVYVSDDTWQEIAGYWPNG